MAVLGAMRELGASSEAHHAALLAPVAAAGVDVLVLVGDEMTPLGDAIRSAGLGSRTGLTQVADAASASEALRGRLAPGDAVLVKGSNGVGLARVVRDLIGTD